MDKNTDMLYLRGTITPQTDRPTRRNRALAIANVLTTISAHGETDLVVLDNEATMLGVTYVNTTTITPEMKNAMSNAATQNNFTYNPTFKDEWNDYTYPVIIIPA